MGRFNGVPGCTFYAQATDAGEPGPGRDTFEMRIWDPNGTLVASISGKLSHGNIQFDRIRWFWHPSKGKGVSLIVPHDKGKEKGIGLDTIKERVELLGGILKIRSFDKMGTSLYIEVPVE